MGRIEYGDSPGRQYDITTAAHTCVQVDGEEQVPLVGEWRWSQRVYPAIRRWISEGTHDFIHGVHEGYYRYPDHQTIHARKIFFIKSAPSYWVVMDWLESNTEREYRAFFHGCLPGELDDTTFLIGEPDGAQLAVIPPAGADVTAERVQDAGWHAYCLVQGIDPHSYPCVSYTTRAMKTCLVWVLAPVVPGQAKPRVTTLPATVNGAAQLPCDMTAIQVAFGDITDVLGMLHRDYDAALQVGDETGHGFLTFVRRDAVGAPLLTITHSVADGSCGR